MNKLSSYILVLVVGLLASGCKPIADLQSPSVLLVDLNAVAKALGRDEVMNQEIQVAEEQLRNQLTQIAGNLQQQVQEEQNKLGEKPEEEELARVQQLAAQAQQTFRNEQVGAQQKAAEVRQQVIMTFRQEVKMVAEQIAKSMGAQMVKVVGGDVLWFDSEADITADVIAKMRAAEG